MGYHFLEASKDLLDAFREQAVPVSVWTGHEVMQVNSSQLEFDIDIDEMFGVVSTPYILVKVDIPATIPTIKSHNGVGDGVTYIIPNDTEFNIENGPNTNRIICANVLQMKKVLEAIKN